MSLLFSLDTRCHDGFHKWQRAGEWFTMLLELFIIETLTPGCTARRNIWFWLLPLLVSLDTRRYEGSHEWLYTNNEDDLGYCLISSLSKCSLQAAKKYESSDSCLLSPLFSLGTRSYDGFHKWQRTVDWFTMLLEHFIIETCTPGCTEGRNIGFWLLSCIRLTHGAMMASTSDKERDTIYGLLDLFIIETFTSGCTEGRNIWFWFLSLLFSLDTQRYEDFYEWLQIWG